MAIFILLLGFLYFGQQKTLFLQRVAIGMHQYLIELKQSDFKAQKNGYSYILNPSEKLKYTIPEKIRDYYYKSFPKRKGKKFLTILVEAKVVDSELKDIKYFTIFLQLILIILFAIISFILAYISIKPMQETISHLDRFIKDLIHDLNTPITSIMLNTKMLKKKIEQQDMRKLERIENSAINILSLYENLNILLDENNLKLQNINLSQIIEQKIEMYRNLYPKIKFINQVQNAQIKSNEKAILRILDNIISNSCKYAVEQNPTIDILFKKNSLTIKDNGKGIKYPQKVFERSYKEEESGYGIGMHIVHRLANSLGIKIQINSKPNYGTEIILNF